MKKLVTAFLVTVFVLTLSFQAFAANVSVLTNNESQVRVAPLIDYSAFMKLKIEKYNDLLQYFFKTVKNNYFKFYNDNKNEEYLQKLDNGRFIFEMV